MIHLVNSRAKGQRGEREFAKVCRNEGYEVRRGQQFSGLEGEDVVGLDKVHVEVKRVNKLNIEKAMEQSIRDAKESQIPIVAHRKDNCNWLITMKVEDWFKLYREFV